MQKCFEYKQKKKQNKEKKFVVKQEFSIFRFLNLSQNVRNFMESLMANFAQFSKALVNFLFLEGRQSARLCLRSTLSFS